MHYLNGVSDHSVKDFVAIAEQWHDADARPLSDRAPTQWRCRDSSNNLLNAFRNPFCNSGITGPGVIGGDIPKIGDARFE
jgi:hypothetical protein